MEKKATLEAIALYDSGVWKSWTDHEIVEYQLYHDNLAVPFGRYGHTSLRTPIDYGKNLRH